MRKADLNDMFGVARLVKELDFKEDLYKAFEGEDDVVKRGYSVVFELFAKATTKDAQRKIYECLSGPFEVTPEELGKKPYMEFVEGFTECFDIGTLVNFIKRVNK